MTHQKTVSKDCWGGVDFWKVTSWLRQTRKVTRGRGHLWVESQQRRKRHSWGGNHGKRLMWTSTDLLSKEGHDGEDDQGHQNAVGPELQLVPVRPPGESSDKRGFCHPDCIKGGVGGLVAEERYRMQRARGRRGDRVASLDAICPLRRGGRRRPSEMVQVSHNYRLFWDGWG